MNNSDSEQPAPQAKNLVKVSLGINLRDEFDTYEDFDKKLKELSKKNFVHFWKRDCRTVEGAKKKTERYIDPKIKYYQLKYSCVHGGRMFKKKNETSQSAKQECEANFYLIATPDGTKLFVKSLNNYHNHEVSESTYLKYFMEEKSKRGRPRKKTKQIKEEVDDEYTSGYIYGKFESDTEEENIHLDSTADYSMGMNVQQYDGSADQSAMIQYDSSSCNQDVNVLPSTKDDDIDQFLKYLGSEIRQIRNKKAIKTLKRKFIALVQKAQDEEDS
ncbi:hypothetical protein ILUMI_01361 [Ignelater luminosus]|uniref:ZSWIM3 N-terminal domain-containing protein n=1 Tax=Ignelater luminosus TaxID=2038154 RepID=A0A8K0DIG9_IGNLU|nr:hypothetical protein ILUMI_01361 [Ignelater luminosus]